MSMGGDRAMSAILTSFLFLGLPAFGFASYKGFFSNIFTVKFGIPNTPFNFTVGFTFLSLTATMIGLMFGVLALVFVAQVISGAKIFGSGGGQLGGTIIVTVIQWSFVLTMIGLFSLITGAAMAPIPYNFGIFYVLLFSIVGMVGVALRLVAAGS